MLFFKIKISPMVDAIAMVCMFVVSRIAFICGVSLFGAMLVVFAALFVELSLSMARAVELENITKLWKMRKKEADHLQKEVDRLNRVIRRESIRHPKKPLKRKG